MSALAGIPEGPQNVRVLRDGQEIPVELVYLGRDPRGVARFASATVPLLPGDKLLVGVLPPRTSIVMHSPDQEAVR